MLEARLRWCWVKNMPAIVISDPTINPILPAVLAGLWRVVTLSQLVTDRGAVVLKISAYVVENIQAKISPISRGDIITAICRGVSRLSLFI